MKCPPTACKPFLRVTPQLVAAAAAIICSGGLAGRIAADDVPGGEEPLPGAKPVPTVQVVPLPDDKAAFSAAGRELTRFHFHGEQRRPFWFPVSGPEGRSLTRMGHPHDPVTHSHHNSVWISHHDVDGTDFWGDHGEGKGRIVTRQVEQYEDGDAFAAMLSVHHWVRDEDQAVLLVERRRAEVRTAAGQSGAAGDDWMLIIDLEFTVPDGRDATTFGRTAFGLAGVRMARSIGVHDGGGRILNSAGLRNEQEVFRKPARWVDYSGRVSNEATGGVTLMDHPLNPCFPSPFHVRDDGWMGACLTLQDAITVRREQPLRLRYGLWIHSGIPTLQRAEAAWSRFAAIEPAEMARKTRGQ